MLRVFMYTRTSLTLISKLIYQASAERTVTLAALGLHSRPVDDDAELVFNARLGNPITQ